jgi:hypothetical protein
MAQDHTGAHTHASPVILYFPPIPVTTNIDQNVVGLRLTVQASACRPKRRMPPGLMAIAEKLDDVTSRSWQHDDLWDKPIRARIGGIPHKINCPVKDIVLSQESDEIAP